MGAADIICNTLFDLAQTAQSHQPQPEEEVALEDASAEASRGFREMPNYSNAQDILFRGRSRSRDSDDNAGHRILRRGASRSRSSTPKNNPKKKLKKISIL